MMLEDEWIVVTAKDKKRVMRKPGNNRTNHVKQRTGPNVGIQLTLLLLDDDSNNDDILEVYVRNCIDIVIKTDLFLNLRKSLDGWLSSTGLGRPIQLRKLVAYGIGNFSNTKEGYHSASLFQLAMVLCLQKKVPECNGFVLNIDFYDPCTTIAERRFLTERFGINVMTSNDRGNYSVINTDTIFFMPHCPPQLYENVIWSNFENLRNIGIIGNSMRHLSERPPPNELLCIKSLMPYLNEFPIVGSSTDYNQVAPLGNFVGAWNDTYLSYYRFVEDLPSRPYNVINAHNVDLELL